MEMMVTVLIFILFVFVLFQLQSIRIRGSSLLFLSLVVANSESSTAYLLLMIHGLV